MAKKRVLFISQEINPYLPQSADSQYGRFIAQGMHSNGCEVRLFMPNYGLVNERRNQLHEVIRLSGLNIIINDHDHPLIIKVASLQPSRIQVYFTDNDDYFQKEDSDADVVGSNRKDNDERAIFFARGTAETIKKLRWSPEVIHCDGWITSLTPLYLRTLMAGEPGFDECKIVYDVLPGEVTGGIDPQIFEKLKADGVFTPELNPLAEGDLDTDTLHLIGISQADGVIFHSDEPSARLLEEVKKRDIPYIILPSPEEVKDIMTIKDFHTSLQK